MSKTSKINIMVSGVLACIGGTLILFMGFSHNSQGEFVNTETGEVDLLYSAMIFLSGFLPSLVVFISLGFLLVFLRSRFLTKSV